MDVEVNDTGKTTTSAKLAHDNLVAEQNRLARGMRFLSRRHHEAKAAWCGDPEGTRPAHQINRPRRATGRPAILRRLTIRACVVRGMIVGDEVTSRRAKGI